MTIASSWPTRGARRTYAAPETLEARKKKLEDPEQRWVFWHDAGGKERIIHREPANEMDALATLWKLEGLGALPFHTFKTLEHWRKRC